MLPKHLQVQKLNIYTQKVNWKFGMFILFDLVAGNLVTEHFL